MRVLLLSAYDAASHRRWRQTLESGIADWEWTVLALPPRHFAWRIRGNPLSWHQHASFLEPYDLVLATSMVDLATLRGLVPALAGVPAALYFHENQFAYPAGRGEHGLLEAQMVSLYSALAADRLLFNSAYNRDSFLAGTRRLLKQLPDQLPAAVPETLAAKSEILPVPVGLPAALDASPRESRSDVPLEIVWNHRWEYDKGPDVLRDICCGLVESGVAFTLHVVGQQFREQPKAFAAIEQILSAHGARGEWGFVADSQAYHQLLAGADVVLSTAQHDFQGLSVIEAVCLGASPLVPDALVYPEWLEDEYRYSGTDSAVEKLVALCRRKRDSGVLPVPDLSQFDPQQLLPRYRAVLAGLAA